MNKMTKVLISLFFVTATPLALACDYPPPPKSLPDGASASKEDMLAGVKMISAYQESMAEYLSCIEAGEVVANLALGKDDDGKKQRKTMFDKKYNAAVEEQTRTVEKFNAEIRAYKANPQ